MKASELASLGLPAFRLGDLSALSGRGHGHLSVDINRMVRQGDVVRLKPGSYALSKRYQRNHHAFGLAQVMHSPSYVTELSAMAYHGLILESVPVTISAYTGKHRVYENTYGRFEFRRINPNLFFGFNSVPTVSGVAWIAIPEKAVLDYFYYRRETWTPKKVEAELRPVAEGDFDKDKLMAYVKCYPRWVKVGVEAFVEVVS